MYGGGREKKSKPSKRAQQAVAAAAAEEQPAQVAPPPRKKGGKNKHFRDESEEFFGEFGIPHESGRSSTGERLGATNLPALSLFPATSESVFKNWEELLGSREALKSRLDTIAAVHGWESQTYRKSFLGGIEPGALLQSMKAEVSAIRPAAEEASKAGLLLELKARHEQIGALSEERDRLSEDIAQLQEDHFEACAVLASQGAELERLRQCLSG